MKSYEKLVEHLIKQNALSSIEEFDPDDPKLLTLSPDISGENMPILAYRKQGEIVLIAYVLDNKGKRQYLGSGTKASIYAGLNLKTMEPVAIKEFELFSPDQRETLLKANAQAYGLYLKIPALVQTQAFGISSDKNYMLTIMEQLYSPLDVWAEKHPVTKAKASSLLKQSITFLQQLTSSGLIHGDLNFWNMMVTEDGQLKVCDIDTLRKRSAKDKTELHALKHIIYALYASRFLPFRHVRDDFSKVQQHHDKLYALFPIFPSQDTIDLTITDISNKLGKRLESISGNNVLWEVVRRDCDRIVNEDFSNIEKEITVLEQNSINLFYKMITQWGEFKDKNVPESQKIELKGLYTLTLKLTMQDYTQRICQLFSHPIVFKRLIQDLETQTNPPSQEVLLLLARAMQVKYPNQSILLLNVIKKLLKPNDYLFGLQLYETAEYDFRFEQINHEIYRRCLEKDTAHQKEEIVQWAINTSDNRFTGYLKWLNTDHKPTRDQTYKGPTTNQKLVNYGVLISIATEQQITLDKSLLESMLKEAISANNTKLAKEIINFNQELAPLLKSDVAPKPAFYDDIAKRPAKGQEVSSFFYLNILEKLAIATASLVISLLAGALIGVIIAASTTNILLGALTGSAVGATAALISYKAAKAMTFFANNNKEKVYESKMNLLHDLMWVGSELAKPNNEA